MTAVAVIAAVAHESATKATPLAVPALRTRLLAAIDTASGDILYAHSESVPGGRTWQSPAYPQPGQEVHFRVLGLGSDGTVFKDGEYSFRMPSGSDAASSYTSNLDQGGLQLSGTLMAVNHRRHVWVSGMRTSSSGLPSTRLVSAPRSLTASSRSSGGPNCTDSRPSS